MSSDSARSQGPRIGVVIPCYNDGATVREALASVDARLECEVVVVDDGSDDPATLVVLDELVAQGVWILRQARGGPSAARMAGVRATSAPYIAPLDADDVLAPGALTRLADALDAAPEAVAAWGDVETFGKERARYRKATALDPWCLAYLNGIPLTGSMVRREALLAVGGWQLRDGYEDWDLWMSFAERGWRGVRVPDITARYRLHGSRRWAGSLRGFEETQAALRLRHAELFARRRANWRRSPAPLRLKILLPLFERLPLLSPLSKQRLSQLASHPPRLLALRLPRPRARLA